MDWVSEPANSVGPTADWYAFPLLSVTDTIRAVVSFQPTTTTFRSPAACAALNGTLTLAAELCGVALLTWTNVMGAGVGGGGGGAGVVALAVFEYAESPAALVARTR